MCEKVRIPQSATRNVWLTAVGLGIRNQCAAIGIKYDSAIRSVQFFEIGSQKYVFLRIAKKEIYGI